MTEPVHTNPLSRWLLLSLYLPSVLLSLCNGLLVPTLPVFAASLEVSYLLIGLILAGDSIGMLLADVPAGALMRHIGRKRAMIVGLTIAALSVGALAFTDSAALVIGLRILAGAGAALFNISRHVFMAEEIPRAGRGRVMALFGGTNRLGDLAGPLAGGFIAVAFGIGATFLVYAGLALVTVWLCWRFVEGSVRNVPEVSGQVPARPAAALAGTLRSEGRLLITAGIGQLCAQAIRTGRRVLIPRYAADVLGLGVDQVGVGVSVAAALDFLRFYFAGVIMDRWGRKWATVPSFLLQALSLALLPLAQDFRSLVLIAGLGGVGNGIGSGTMMTLGADLAPPGRTGEFLGLWRLVGDVGSATGPLLVGAVAQVLGLGPSAGVVAMLGAGGSMLFAFAVPETLSRKARS